VRNPGKVCFVLSFEYLRGGDDPRRRAQPTFISRKRIVARASVAFARFGSRDHEALGVHAN